MKKFLVVIFTLFVAVTGYTENLSPLDYGLNKVKSGLECYEVLMRTHRAAVEKGCGITYEGIKQLSIEIPAKAEGIPLPEHTNFAGVTMNVTNRSERMSLFVMENHTTDLVVTKKRFERLKFGCVKGLRKGMFLLIVEDKTPWVKNRIGYSYGMTRRDVILIEDGRAKNSPVMPYSNDVSTPAFKYCKVTNTPKVIQNLTFNRTKSSTQITCLVKIEAQNNVQIKNVTINTPEGTGFYSDEAIILRNSTNVLLEDVTINGTYSRTDKYGYGIGMNNVWNSRFVRVKAHGNWGVFGNNNVNYAVLEDCDINRFDIHCYGRDIYAKNTTFRNLYNQFSATYGVVKYENCTFDKCTPYLNADSYNAFVPVDVIFENCSFHLTKERNALLRFMGLTEQINPREELSTKCMPNVTINNCKMVVDDDVEKWYVIHPGGVRYKEPLGNISRINVSIDTDKNTKKKMVVIPDYVKTKNKLEIMVE